MITPTREKEHTNKKNQIDDGFAGDKIKENELFQIIKIVGNSYRRTAIFLIVNLCFGAKRIGSNENQKTSQKTKQFEIKIVNFV